MNVAGHRIGTMEVESALVDHPSVAEAAVVGVADELKGTAIAAFCILKEKTQAGAAAGDGPERRAARPRRQEDRRDRAAGQALLRRGPSQDALGQDHAAAAPGPRRGPGPGRHDDARRPGCPGDTEEEVRGSGRVKPLAERIAPAVWIVAAVKLLAHLVTTGRFGYEYFVDELYFDACARHLAWGYIDMPPLHPALTAVVRATLGDTLFAIRLLPAVAGAALVLLTAATRPRPRRRARGPAPRRHRGDGRADLSRRAQLLVHERVGTAALDGLRDPARAAPRRRRPAALARIRASRRHGPSQQAHDGALRRRRRGRTGLDLPRPRALSGPVDLDRRGGGVLRVPAQPRVEHPRGLPLFRAPAGDPGGRAQRRALARLLPGAAGSLSASAERAALARRARLAALRAAPSRTSLPTRSASFISRSSARFSCSTAASTTSRRPTRCSSRPAASPRSGFFRAGRSWVRPAYAALLVAGGIFLSADGASVASARNLRALLEGASACSRRPSRRIAWGRCPSFWRIASAGERWLRRPRAFSTPCRRRSAPARGCSARTTDRRVRSTCTDRRSGFRRRFRGTSRTTRGGRRPSSRASSSSSTTTARRSKGLFESVEYGGRVAHPYSMPYQHFDVWVCRRPRMPLRELWPRLRQLG